jgi:aspartate ammonia-lyase
VVSWAPEEVDAEVPEVAYRIERDPLGEVRVPAEALYGAQTARAVENFPVSGLRPHPQFVTAMVLIKKAAAEANMATGRLDPAVGRAIVAAADEVLAGQHRDQFVVDPYQAGAGTSHNMNVNEVLANRASEILGGRRGDRRVHPNDHVNMAQSTNDTIPTAIRLGCIALAEPLLAALDACADAFAAKAREFDGILKAGRTHLQDAVPIRLGQEFGAYAETVRRGRERIASARDALFELNIGGTAVGTGLNAEPAYIDGVVANLARYTGWPLRRGRNLVQLMQSMGDFVALSGTLRTLAVDLNKIANDLRLMASGPRTGLGEIRLPAVQPGSSIMPGKVNPVLCEMLNMVCYQVIGNDLTVAAAGEAGQLELNVMMPVIAHNLFWSLTILAGGVRAFTERCVRGIEADAERCRMWLEASEALVTALAPYIGYEAAAAVGKETVATGKPIPQIVLERGLLPEDRLREILAPEAMTEPGIPGSR